MHKSLFGKTTAAIFDVLRKYLVSIPVFPILPCSLLPSHTSSLPLSTLGPLSGAHAAKVRMECKLRVIKESGRTGLELQLCHLAMAMLSLSFHS